MVNPKQTQFVNFARIYVTNRGYPSIHVYTVDEGLIDYLQRTFNARKVPHKGTFDVVITKREDLCRAATVLAAYRTGLNRAPALALLKYCSSTNAESRQRVATRLSRQLQILNSRRD